MGSIVTRKDGSAKEGIAVRLSYRVRGRQGAVLLCPDTVLCCASAPCSTQSEQLSPEMRDTATPVGEHMIRARRGP